MAVCVSDARAVLGLKKTDIVSMGYLVKTRDGLISLLDTVDREYKSDIQKRLDAVDVLIVSTAMG